MPFGRASPVLDAETLALAKQLLVPLGAKHLCFELNSLGDPATRCAFHAALVDYQPPFMQALSVHSMLRLVKNPLRILASMHKQAQEIVADAPSILAY